MGNEMSLEILNPRGEIDISYWEPAPRLADLKDKTIALIDNKKSGAREFLTILRSLFEKDFEGIRFVDLSKDYGEKHRIDNFMEELRSIDAAIYSTGD
jgi:hypothetical protein